MWYNNVMRFNYKNTSGITQKDVESVLDRLTPYFGRFQQAADDASYTTDESSLHLAHDARLRRLTEKLVVEKRTNTLSEVMVVGIGGSSLGALAVYEALVPAGVSLSFFDTVHARELAEGAARLRWVFKRGGTVLINIISKSGGTSETIANGRVLLDALKKSTKDWHKHVVVTTEAASKLEIWAASHGVAVLPNPKKVGGRYSVFSPVGAFPLALAGVDIKKFHKGASTMLKLCLVPDAKKNPALQSAVAMYAAIKKRKVAHNVFVFNPDLEGAGKWYRQLVGESLGKKGKGMLPLVSVGSTDLHSVGQLYLGGPKNIFTTFVSVASSGDLHIPPVDIGFDGIVPELNNVSMRELLDAIYKGTKGAYQKRNVPFVEVVLEKLNEEEIGAFMQFKMVETMLLGRLMGVNAFDQPNVEEYKIITRRLLGGN